MTNHSGRYLTVSLRPETRELLLRMTLGDEELARQLAARAVIKGANEFFHVLKEFYDGDQRLGINRQGTAAERDILDSDDHFGQRLTRKIVEANEPPF